MAKIVPLLGLFVLVVGINSQLLLHLDVLNKQHTQLKLGRVTILKCLDYFFCCYFDRHDYFLSLGCD